MKFISKYLLSIIIITSTIFLILPLSSTSVSATIAKSKLTDFNRELTAKLMPISSQLIARPEDIEVAPLVNQIETVRLKTEIESKPVPIHRLSKTQDVQLPSPSSEVVASIKLENSNSNTLGNDKPIQIASLTPVVGSTLAAATESTPNSTEIVERLRAHNSEEVKRDFKKVVNASKNLTNREKAYLKDNIEIVLAAMNIGMTQKQLPEYRRIHGALIDSYNTSWSTRRPPSRKRVEAAFDAMDLSMKNLLREDQWSNYLAFHVVLRNDLENNNIKKQNRLWRAGIKFASPHVSQDYHRDESMNP